MLLLPVHSCTRVHTYAPLAQVGGYNTFFTWLNCLVDAAIYPVMAARYTTELLTHFELQHALSERTMCIIIVVLMTAMQLRGLDWMVLAPCLATTAYSPALSHRR